MKNLLLKLTFIIVPISVFGQENLDDLLAAGIQDAERFTTDYINPASEGVAFGINNGWFSNASSLKRFGFEVSFIGNVSFIKDEKKSFELNVSEYENIRFPDNSPSKSVATSLGHNDPDISVIVTYDDPIFGDQEFELTLPTGIGSANVNLIPTAFLQGSFSPFSGTQIKGRFFPKIDTEDVDLGLYGVGIQQEFTSWLPADKLLPISISGLIAYTHLDGSYDFTDTNVVDGENQQIKTEVNTMLYQLIVGTKLKIINFYGSIGYLKGKTTTDLLGTYRVSNGVLTSEEIVDPFSIKSDMSGMRTTLGTHLKLGFFRLNFDYTLAEFDSATVGLSFGFR